MRNVASLGLAFALGITLFTGDAYAQVGLSRRDQAALYAYNTQLMAQQRMQMQQQAQQFNRQMQVQQREVQMQQLQDAALFEYLNALGGATPGATLPRTFSGNRAATAFGTVHYVSPYYMRLQPYYNYQFVRTRNRQVTNVANSVYGY
jgi:hypothetical protein